MTNYEDCIPENVNTGKEIFVAVADINSDLVEMQRTDELTFKLLDKTTVGLYLALLIFVEVMVLLTNGFSFLLLILGIGVIGVVYLSAKGIEFIEIKLFPRRINKKYDDLLNTKVEILGIFENGLILGPYVTRRDHEFVNYKGIEEIDMKLHRPLTYNDKSYYGIKIICKDQREYIINWEEFIYTTYPVENNETKAILDNFTMYYDTLSQMKEKYML